MFSEIKLFQVKPDKVAEFEALIAQIQESQRQQPGCSLLRYQKRFFVLDEMEPRELTKIVKCVKCYSDWEFDNKESYTAATQWFFATHSNAEKIRGNLDINLRIGADDVLFCDNQIMHCFLTSLNIPHQYNVISGDGHELMKII